MCPLYLLLWDLPLDVSLVPPPLGFTLGYVPCTSSPGLHPWMCPLYLFPGALPLNVSLALHPGLYFDVSPVPLLRGFTL